MIRKEGAQKRNEPTQGDVTHSSFPRLFITLGPFFLALLVYFREVACVKMLRFRTRSLMLAREGNYQ
jgi:hypothetical protein